MIMDSGRLSWSVVALLTALLIASGEQKEVVTDASAEFEVEKETLLKSVPLTALVIMRVVIETSPLT